MQISEFLREDDTDLGKLKSLIIADVKSSNDRDLLNQIYTSIHSSGLEGRVSSVLTSDTDTAKYSKALSALVVSTAGTYEEKEAFASGYPTGYIDVATLLSGKRVSFDQIIQGGDFVKRVFDKMFPFTVEDAGPGEFALAALSPQLRMRNNGDLWFKNQYIEVKASAGSGGGGRLGVTGATLKFEKIPEIFAQFKTSDSPYGTQSFSISKLPAWINANVEPNRKRQFAEILFGYIFGKKTPGLVAAALGNGNIVREYFAENFYAYKKQAGWEGILLLSMRKRSALYGKNPENFFGKVTNSSASLNPEQDTGFAGRQILSPIELA